VVGSAWLRCADRRLELGTPRVMGILNATPDSFSDGGRFYVRGRLDVDRAIEAARSMVEAGAAIVDVGGESTRPGAAPITAAEEIDRVMPIVERLIALDTIVSVDTSKADVAREALRHGAGMINDVRGFCDPELLATVAGSQAALCVMHMRGDPATMQVEPRYDDVVAEVTTFLAERARACVAAGVAPDRVVVDPGFGFGKTRAHNLSLLRALDRIGGGYPVLVGLSRKRTIGDLTGRDAAGRVAGSVAAALLAAEHGADFVRVHDVPQTVDALRVLAAFRDRREGRDG
jgi:dihydropteroate synthase